MQTVTFNPTQDKRFTLPGFYQVNLTSKSVKKLEKYKRFNIQEVWLWKNNKFSLCALENDDYQPIFQSKLLPNLNFKLLEECVLMPSQLEAMKTFISNQ